MTSFEKNVAAMLVFFLIAGLSVRVWSARSGKPVKRVAAQMSFERVSNPGNATKSESRPDHSVRSPRKKTRKTTTKSAAKSEKIDSPVSLNRATLEELVALPKVGPALAKKILEAREARGGFKRKEDLMTVPGIKEGLYRAIEPHIIFEPD